MQFSLATLLQSIGPPHHDSTFERMVESAITLARTTLPEEAEAVVARKDHADAASLSEVARVVATALRLKLMRGTTVSVALLGLAGPIDTRQILTYAGVMVIVGGAMQLFTRSTRF